MEMYLQPVEDRAPPDAAIAGSQHPVPFVGKREKLRVETHALRRRKRLISFREIDPVVELAVHDQDRRLPVTDMIERRPLLVEIAIGVERAAELPIGEPQLFGAAGHADGLKTPSWSTRTLKRF